MNFKNINTNKATAKCPHCDREEDFGDYTTGMAWIHAHIMAEHAEELPPLENNDT